MATAGNITAVLTLNSSGFQTGLTESTTAVDNFKKAIMDFNTNQKSINNGLNEFKRHLDSVKLAISGLDTVNKTATTNLDKISMAIKRIVDSFKLLSNETIDVERGMTVVNTIFTEWGNVINNTTVKVQGVTTALREVKSEMSSTGSSAKQMSAQFKQAQADLMGLAKGVEPLARIRDQADAMKREFERSRAELLKFAETGVSAFNQVDARSDALKVQIASMNAEFERSKAELMEFARYGRSQFGTITSATVQYAEALEIALPPQRQLITGNRELMTSSEQVAVSEEKQSVATDKATNSMRKQTTASKGLKNALSSLKMMGTMVGSMIAYNFVHNLAMATTETINAKSEMNGYFQMLGYTTRQTQDFNKALDDTVKKFPRLNKYALGETISSIGVEFELTTAEMKKAMPVVSMITSEYLRAGRNVNEASLAVKDILQGEFQRLSRETGVKGDQLKEAGWSGDKTDVMGLLKALEKVGKERNWDTFVQKANSLNDAVLITQNRFSEWSADMVERVQPAIVGAFNSMMSVAEVFASVINGVADWLGGEGLGQDIVKWGGLATAIIGVTGALIKYRTGANLTQIAQMGLTKSIGASILGLEAETVAEYGLRNAITSTVTGIEAETLANEENVITRKARLQAIASTITGYELETVANKGVLKSLVASTFGAKESTFAQYGLSTAIAEATTQMEAEKLASMGLAQRITLIGMSTLPAIAVVGAFAVAFGKLALETMEATEKMSKFYDIQKNGKQYVDDAKDSVKNIKDHIKELKETQKDYTKGSAEYNNVGKAIDNLNGKLEIAKQNVKDNYEAWQRVNSAQKNYDTTKQELQLDLQQKINQSLVDTGMSLEEANELSNTYLNDAIDGSGQLYNALQSVALQYEKEAQGVASITDYWSDKGLSDDEIKLKVDPYIDSSNAIAQDIEKMKLSTDLIEVASTWGKLQIDQWDHTMDENLPKIEAGDWIGGLTGMLKGLAHGLADLPVFGDFWDWVFDYANIKETYGGKGWAGLDQWINDSIWVIGDHLTQLFTGMTWDELGGHVMSMLDKFISDPLGSLGIDLGEFDLVGSIMDAITSDSESSSGSGGSSVAKKIDPSALFGDLSGITQWFDDNIKKPVTDWWNGFISFDWLPSFDFDIWSLFGFDTVSASDGSSDHPSFMEDISNIIGFDIQSWITNFNSDPLGTLGIQLPNIDIIGLITSLIPIGGEGGFDIGGWLNSIFDISGIVSTFTSNLQVIFTTASSIASNVSGVFSNLKSMIWGHIQGILSNVTSTFTNIKNTAVTQINGLRSGIQGGIDQVKNAFIFMKDSILDSAKKIYDGVKAKFDSVKTTIGDFWHKLTNPSSWGSAGSESYQRRSPKPHTARKMFSPVVRSAVHHGAGVNPYQNDSQIVRLKDLMDMVNGDNKVRLSDFLAMFSEGGFGTWDFHEPVKTKVFDTAKGYKTGSPNIKGIGTVGDGYKVGKFWDGKPSFSFDEFMTVAQAIFSAIPYKFYYDSEWKGNWVNALLSGAVNCSDGADALIALANVFGISGYKQHTTLKSGVGHFFAVIGGKPMDTTNFQNHGSWSPLGGAGIPTRTSHSSRGAVQGNTTNHTINVTITGDVYGVDDLESRIEEGVKRGLRDEFNDPYTVAI